MRLYLVQHGLARSESEDPERRLSCEGTKETEAVARLLASRGITVEAIAHSPKPRAKETAHIFAGHLKPAGGVTLREGLGAKDDPRIWRDLLHGENRDLMLVGHLPHMAGLASLLLCGESDREIIRFKNSGVVCLERREGNPSWSVIWMIGPGIL